MLTVENVNVGDNDPLVRDGWSKQSFPACRDKEGEALLIVWGWVRGPFGIFDREFDDVDAGRIAATSLVHLKNGLRIRAFSSLEVAAEAAEEAEPLADWDALIADAVSKEDAYGRIDAVLERCWKDYFTSDLFSPDAGRVFYHNSAWGNRRPANQVACRS
jgi:hypothetical protein